MDNKIILWTQSLVLIPGDCNCSVAAFIQDQLSFFFSFSIIEVKEFPSVFQRTKCVKYDVLTFKGKYKAIDRNK